MTQAKGNDGKFIQPQLEESARLKEAELAALRAAADKRADDDIVQYRANEQLAHENRMRALNAMSSGDVMDVVRGAKSVEQLQAVLHAVGDTYAAEVATDKQGKGKHAEQVRKNASAVVGEIAKQMLDEKGYAKIAARLTSDDPTAQQAFARSMNVLAKNGLLAGVSERIPSDQAFRDRMKAVGEMPATIIADDCYTGLQHAHPQMVQAMVTASAEVAIGLMNPDGTEVRQHAGKTGRAGVQAAQQGGGNGSGQHR